MNNNNNIIPSEFFSFVNDHDDKDDRFVPYLESLLGRFAPHATNDQIYRTQGIYSNPATQANYISTSPNVVYYNRAVAWANAQTLLNVQQLYPQQVHAIRDHITAAREAAAPSFTATAAAEINLAASNAPIVDANAALAALLSAPTSLQAAQAQIAQLQAQIAQLQANAAPAPDVDAIAAIAALAAIAPAIVPAIATFNAIAPAIATFNAIAPAIAALVAAHPVPEANVDAIANNLGGFGINN